ncbi:hypothetical protein J3U11_08190 [Gilliamella sp. B2840]|uniref:hypothetical protein n=1 Tax=unclassified Gilliamella TaxID=2685620 RepID=UPI00226AB418|nr:MULTISPECIES: hypothetical protein [unclassified Gilliamella]MCX8656738.1 hypothetical protein [Gilliamella sp. B2894]MCX8665518.1 hypothetical protein [Gilliamella sp. B2887]MCX8694256.1 hypothetical protein [Gilliamella sp. B2881]MCX8696661.1 hypothetical protein [Gilliamella sp. B2828]MCX8699362.1 hypothetical protein [Gilliamella sp. B3000]
MRNVLLSLLLIISFPAFSSIYAYKGYIADNPIMLYIETYLNHINKGFWVYQNDFQQHLNTLSNECEFIRSCPENRTRLVLYDEQDIYIDEISKKIKVKDSSHYFKFINLHFEHADTQKFLPETLKGYWFDGKVHQQYSVVLQKQFVINDQSTAELNRIELLQSTSLSKVYFTAVLSKQKNNHIKLVGINVYDKKHHNLLQQIQNLDYSYNGFNSISLEDINFDGKADLAIKKYRSNARLGDNYDYYLNDNGKFIATNLWGSNINFNKKDKSATGTKTCYDYDEKEQKILIQIDSVYHYKNKHYIHKSNHCQIHFFNAQISRQCTEMEYNACLLKRNNINTENPHYLGEDNILHKNMVWDKGKLIDGVIDD